MEINYFPPYLVRKNLFEKTLNNGKLSAAKNQFLH